MKNYLDLIPTKLDNNKSRSN